MKRVVRSPEIVLEKISDWLLLIAAIHSFVVVNLASFFLFY